MLLGRVKHSGVSADDGDSVRQRKSHTVEGNVEGRACGHEEESNGVGFPRYDGDLAHGEVGEGS